MYLEVGVNENMLSERSLDLVFGVNRDTYLDVDPPTHSPTNDANSFKKRKKMVLSEATFNLTSASADSISEYEADSISINH